MSPINDRPTLTFPFRDIALGVGLGIATLAIMLMADRGGLLAGPMSTTIVFAATLVSYFGVGAGITGFILAASGATARVSRQKPPVAPTRF